MRRCKRCGGPLADKDRFCGVCGEPQASGTARKQAPSGSSPNRSRRRRRLVIAAVVVLLIAAVGVAAYFFDAPGRVQAFVAGLMDSDAAQTETAAAGDTSSDGDAFVLMEAGCTDQVVTDEASARAALADVADALGIEDVSSELADCTESSALDISYWRFSQYYEGIPVLGRSVAVGADADGQVVAITSTFYPLDDVSTESTIAADEAEEAAIAHLDGSTWSFAASTAVYAVGDETPCLAWIVPTGSDESAEIVYVNAQTGEVIASEPCLDAGTAVGTGTNTSGESVSFNIWQDDDGTYRLFDNERNINAYDANTCTLQIMVVLQGDDGVTYYYSPGADEDDRWSTDAGSVSFSSIPDCTYVGMTYSVKAFWGSVDTITSDTTEFDDEKAVTAYVGAQTAYDFYANTLGRTGFNDAGGTVDIFVDNFNDWDFGNSYSWSNSEIGSMALAFGWTADLTVDLVAHEYTHGVQKSICSLGSSGEPKALAEALADFMAELVEDYANDGRLDGDCDWVVAGRNLADPSQSTTSENGRTNVHPSTYEDEYWGDTSSDYDNGYAHNNSTVISHALYLMCTDEDGLLGSALSTEDMARLVYGTMYLLVDNADFAQFRTCMELAGRTMANQGLLSNDQLVRIAAAFDAVNVDSAWAASSLRTDDSGSADAVVDEATDAMTAVQDKIDIVLVLDTSSSMSGEPIEAMREAASSFVQTVESSTVRVGLVSYGSTSAVLSPLTTDSSSLSYAIGQLGAANSTNMDAGLQDAAGLLATDDDRTRIIVLMSDGMPNEGRVGDELIAYADELKADGIHIYTLCFNAGAEQQALLTAMADECCDYSATESDELEGFFTDIASFIAGERFHYVSFACPVDVEVTLGDETLSSREENLCTRTSFGTLSLRESDEDDGTIKVLRLRDGEEYEIVVTGYADGTMDYTVGFCDEDGVYTDQRTFTAIPVTETMSAYTTVAREDTTELYVDEDGDGVIDIAWRAGAGEEAETFDNRIIAWVIATPVLVLFAAITVLRFVSFGRLVKRGASGART